MSGIVGGYEYGVQKSKFKRDENFPCCSSAERRKKIDEFYVAKEDLENARQRKEKEKYDKIEEQRKVCKINYRFVFSNQLLGYDRKTIY